ncbi:MAG: ASCH domain-containing protein [Patescibacteria group bacterium]
MSEKRTHIAIMKSAWNLTEKILRGEKKIESRWYENRYRPWGKINKGDVIYFRDSGKPVTAKAEVSKVEQYSNLNKEKIEKLLKKYPPQDLGITKIFEEVKKYAANKNYCIFITLENPQPVEPFEIDKTGYGAMASWLIVDDIKKIKINP